MKTIKGSIIAGLLFIMLSGLSCKKLTDLNINPNGTAPETVNPTFLMTYVLTETAKNYLDMGYNDPMPGVMQMTQKDAWSSGNNDYQWSDQSWSGYYGLLRNNQKAYERALDENNNFVAGVSLVMKSFLFGLITDLWGDAPYSAALKGDLDGVENQLPAYDKQEDIYKGIITDLKAAASLLGKSTSSSNSADVYYGGNAQKWQKFANSLLLRYYNRLSVKLPDFAKAGIGEVVASGIYFKGNEDDATMAYLGTTRDNSWPASLKYDDTNGSNFRRIKMCSTFVEALQGYKDPRLGVWAAKVQIPIVISSTMSTNPDIIINGKRYIYPSAIPAGTLVDTDPEYVGIPPSIGSEPSWYNLNPTPGQLSNNPHVSYLNDVYKNTNGGILKARLMSYAEVNFILAEAAQKGWSAGSDAKTLYNAGVKASLDYWGVGSSYNTYIANAGVVYDGTIRQIITQKWIASWTNAQEAWFDYRRTGFPVLQAGPRAKRAKLPIRYLYSGEESNLNSANYQNAIKNLESTNYSGPEGVNSNWSKPWLLQGTNQPW